MTLGQKQRLFAWRVGKLIEWSYANGYELTFGETLRTQAEALHNAAQGDGIAHSLHLIRLAIDLNLFINGEYRSDLEAYRPLGDFWKSLSTPDALCVWGGDFHKPDGDHFSIEHEGVR